jgi:hypothetical protein
MKMLPKTNGKYTEIIKMTDYLHSKFGPFSTVVVKLGFVIRIGPDLVDQSEHAAVNRVLNDALELAVNVYSGGVSLEAVPHLRNNKYNQ